MPFEIIRGDITRVKADAIVNAANIGLKRGGGVCGAIFYAAGAKALQKECDTIGKCAVGGAVLTKAYNLPADYIIHCVGPVWQGGGENEEALLRSAYKNALQLAKEHGLNSIAFPLISAGIYGYPKGPALKVATQTIQAFLAENDMLVTLVIYDNKAFELSEKLFNSVTQ
ncbi:MAG TPA: macro domain-containing protein, partial [Clostridia bacterium]|nr:macro domain-containing protein [Clostridia bacterium]